MSPRGKAALALGALAVLTALEAWRLANPAPAPPSTAVDQFSAARAVAALHDVSIDAPHAITMPGHDLVRDRIAAALRALDYQVELQRTFACNAYAMCGSVDNLIARRADDPPGKAVVLAAHYDSVPGGPGASDDGTGVGTALELARAVRKQPFANPIVFLIDDGEEAGLLGAEGYVADPARGRDAAFVINLEARGTTGTPFLFETSREQRWLIPIVAGALPHPFTTSLFATIYDQLPNDTDLTVFKRAGRAGINLAYLGGVAHYHTPLDDFAHVDEGAVQRRGDQALAMLRAFGNARLDDPAPDGAVWFDVFATILVWWPTSWSLGIALVGIALVVAAIGICRRRGGVGLGGVGLGGVGLGVASMLVTLIVAAVLGDALTRLLSIHAGGELYVPHPGAMLAAAWAAGLAAALATGGLVRRWASFDAVVAGQALGWLLLGVALDAMLPGAAYAAIVPGVVIAAALVVRQIARLPAAVVAIAGLIATAVLLLPFVLFGYEALGNPSVMVVAILIALAGSTFAPLLAASRAGGEVVEHGTAARLAIAAVAAAAVLAVIGMLAPIESAAEPARVELAHITNSDTGVARWQIGDPTASVRALLPFAEAKVVPWYGRTAEVAPAPPISVVPPTAAIAATAINADGTRTITLDLASPRRAARMSLAWRSDAEVVAIRVNGVPLPPRPTRFFNRLAAGWHRILVSATSARVELTVRGAAPAEARLADTSFGLPPIGAPLAAARDATGAVPFQDGDVTVVERRLAW